LAIPPKKHPVARYTFKCKCEEGIVEIKLNIAPTYGKSPLETRQVARRALAATIIANLDSSPAGDFPDQFATDLSTENIEAITLTLPGREAKAMEPFASDEYFQAMTVELSASENLSGNSVSNVPDLRSAKMWQSSLKNVEKVFAAESDPMFDFLFDSDAERCEQSIIRAIEEAYKILDLSPVSTQRDENFHENLFRITEALKGSSVHPRNNVRFVTCENLKRPA
jgi:hypothetical protein